MDKKNNQNRNNQTDDRPSSLASLGKAYEDLVRRCLIHTLRTEGRMTSLPAPVFSESDWETIYGLLIDRSKFDTALRHVYPPIVDMPLPVSVTLSLLLSQSDVVAKINAIHPGAIPSEPKDFVGKTFGELSEMERKGQMKFANGLVKTLQSVVLSFADTLRKDAVLVLLSTNEVVFDQSGVKYCFLVQVTSANTRAIDCVVRQ